MSRYERKSTMRIRIATFYMALFVVVLLLVVAILFTLSLSFEDTHYGLTRLRDLEVWSI